VFVCVSKLWYSILFSFIIYRISHRRSTRRLNPILQLHRINTLTLSFCDPILLPVPYTSLGLCSQGNECHPEPSYSIPASLIHAFHFPHLPSIRPEIYRSEPGFRFATFSLLRVSEDRCTRVRSRAKLEWCRGWSCAGLVRGMNVRRVSEVGSEVYFEFGTLKG
jgi:hypothetical protein